MIDEFLIDDWYDWWWHINEQCLSCHRRRRLVMHDWWYRWLVIIHGWWYIYICIYIYYIHIYTRVMYTYYSLMKRESCSWRRCAVNFIIFFSSCDIYMPIFWGGNWCDCIEDWLVIYKLPGTSYLSSRHRHVSWHILSVIRFRSSLRSVLYQTCDTRVDIAAGILVADKKWGDMLEPACTCATTAAAVGAPCHFL